MDFDEMRNAYLRVTQDDIVTRLRNIHTMGQLGVVHEAADEIERLRLELREARSEIQRLTTQANYAS